MTSECFARRTIVDGRFNQDQMGRIVTALRGLGFDRVRDTAKRAVDDGRTIEPPVQNMRIYVLGEVPAGKLRIAIPDIVINVISPEDIDEEARKIYPHF